MKNKSILRSDWFIVFLIILLCFFSLLLKKANERINILKNDYRETKNALEECQKYNIFQETVLEIGKIPWSQNYDCHDHSKDLAKKLNEKGIYSVIFINENRDHAWVCPWIEAINGEFIDSANEYNPIEVRDSELRILFNKEH